MAFRCKLTAKQNLGNGKIKKGDVITFVTQSNSGNPNHQMMCEAVANFIGEKDWKRVQTFAQNYQYDIKYERM